MAPELPFPQSVRTTANAPQPCPREIASVEQAVDWVQELPASTLHGPRWKPVFAALWAALDARDDAQRRDTAFALLTAALAAEGWLDDGTH